jgi:single-strand selective monofunctional uracil DNA glycosylase
VPPTVEKNLPPASKKRVQSTLRTDPGIYRRLTDATRTLRKAVEKMRFREPVTHVYDPLQYARRSYAAYLRTWGASHKRVVFLGMNPGPFGMAQTGVPFGEVALVRDWLGIEEPVDRPSGEHPKRQVQGFECQRSEVSGRRLWGTIALEFETPERFFAEHFVANYCPLVFMESSGRNRTPDKLPSDERQPLFEACDAHLRRLVAILEPEWLIGVGAFAKTRAALALDGLDVKVETILHPSPANPRANADWAGAATAQLRALGLWSLPS